MTGYRSYWTHDFCEYFDECLPDFIKDKSLDEITAIRNSTIPIPFEADQDYRNMVRFLNACVRAKRFLCTDPKNFIAGYRLTREKPGIITVLKYENFLVLTAKVPSSATECFIFDPSSPLGELLLEKLSHLTLDTLPDNQFFEALDGGVITLPVISRR